MSTKPEAHMLRRVRYRAKLRGIRFDLTAKDIKIPKRCPVLGIPLRVTPGQQSDNSPSLDRIRPKRGYVKGNVVVISMRANRIKSDATIQEIQRMAKFYGRYA